MNFELTTRLNNYLIENKLDDAIQLAENQLKDIPKTDFHKILNRNLKHLAEPLTNFLTEFYQLAEKEIEVKAIYSEMNGFTINTDLWFIDLFAFTELGTLDDLDWLSDFEISAEESMVISGFEDLQSVYENIEGNEVMTNRDLNNAYEVCELIIILRLQELFQESLKIAIKNDLTWKNIPLFVTAHDSELIYEVKP
ncbi:MAG: hypothetical protein CVV22_04560 [Ignavibacteriae bacterium HGW-Ignavibacteriae-1]|jgi:hypothetical protein|nr:MAG: hypothetical protein CVV22_04560 [Ignavibacteriae bacterium HGW-Ignavibacteriae-1]